MHIMSKLSKMCHKYSMCKIVCTCNPFLNKRNSIDWIPIKYMEARPYRKFTAN